MKHISSVLAVMLCLTMFSGLTFAAPVYADDLDLTYNYHDLNTINSWFQPWVQRRVPTASFAWTAIGTVYYGNSGQKPTTYWDSGAIIWYNSAVPCQKYKAAYISGARIKLYWVSVDGTRARATSMVNLADPSDRDKYGEIHEKDFIFGNVTE